MLSFTQSPVEDMNIGDLRIAILTYILSQQRNEDFNICIDDLNKTDITEGKDTEIMQVLEKFALIHNSVFHKSEHLHMYQTLAIKLLEEEKAFVCTCDSKQEKCSNNCENLDKTEYAKLKKSAEPFVVRIKKSNNLDDFTILNQDASPIDDFASICDNMLLGVTYVIQEDTNIHSINKQKHIKEALGYSEEITYIQLQKIINSDKISIKWLFEEGFLPDAIINYLLLLSGVNSPKDIFTLPEAISWLKIENIPKNSMEFNINKLRTINKEHLKNMEDKSLSKLFNFADADIGKLAKIYLKKEASTIKELKAKIEPIFSPKDFQCVYGEQMRTLETLIQNAPMFHNYVDFEADLIDKSKMSKEDFSVALRLLLAGVEHGVELSNIYPYIKPYILEIAS